MFRENYLITGTIVCESGLHIGGSSDSVDIGGSDNPVIRDVITGHPYIPGSSLKGKLRSLLELSDKQSSECVKNNKGKVASDENCIAVQLFGTIPKEDVKSEDNVSYQTRTIIRDSLPTEETIVKWENADELYAGSEIKWENTINRITSEAKPRNIERIPRGSEFNLEIIFSTYAEGDYDNLTKLFESMQLLENNYLGGSGSRGSGQIKFKDIKIVKRNIKFYTEDADEEIIAENVDVIGAINVL